MPENNKPIYQLLDTIGDQLGSTEVNGDYSVTPQGFKFKPTENSALIERAFIMIEDSGSFDSGLYGNGLSLTNGIRVYLRDKDDNIITEYTSFPIKTNGDWAGHCFDFNHFNWGAGNEVAAVRWTFSKAGEPIFISAHKGEYLEFYLNDDFSGLIKHRFTIQGKYVS